MLSVLELSALMFLSLLLCRRSSGFTRRYITVIIPTQSSVSSKMDPQKAKLLDCNEDGIKESASILNDGGLVAFPTETVYGLGANALNAASVKNIFLAKKRPANDPLIVHILSKEYIYDLFDFSGLKADIGEKSRAQVVCELLMDAFWPGPLTVIFKAKPAVPSEVTSGTGFVGLRSPRHLIARKLLEASRLPVAAPSANRFGHVSPTSPEHVFEDLGSEDIAILRDDVALSGGCKIGIESTVCKVSSSGEEVSILRCGAVTASDIAAALQERGAGILNDLSEGGHGGGNGQFVRVSIDNEKALRSSSSPSTASQPVKSDKEEEEYGVQQQIKSSVAGVGSDHGKDSNDHDVSHGGKNSGGDSEAAAVAVAPGQMIRHYAPDVPTYIISRASSSRGTRSYLSIIGETHSPIVTTGASEITSTQQQQQQPPLSISSAFVIDFGGRLSSYRETCAVYEDLSPTASTAEACEQVFRVLRYTESEEVRVRGVDTVLLPDLRDAAEDDELLRALWERLHRAASGTFVQ